MKFSWFSIAFVYCLICQNFIITFSFVQFYIENIILAVYYHLLIQRYKEN